MQLFKKKVDKHIIIGVLLAVSFVFLYFAGTYTGFVQYSDNSFIGFDYKGYGSGASFGGLLDIYYGYAQWIDFFVFLLIFLALAKSVFGKQFKEGSKALYVGLGIFLALALVIWEVKTGNSLVEIFGPIVVLFLFVMIIFVFFKHLMKNISRKGLMLICGIYLIFYLIFTFIPVVRVLYYSSWLYYNLPDLTSIFALLAVLAVIGFIVTVLFKRGG